MTNTITSTIINTPEGIAGYRVLALKAALSLESKGIKMRRGFSAYATIKREFGFTGSKLSVLAQLQAWCDVNLLAKHNAGVTTPASA